MLKTLFWLLLIVNGGLFALHRGYLGSLIDDGREPQRMTNQLHPDKVKLLSASAAAALATPAAAALAAPEPAAAARGGQAGPDRLHRNRQFRAGGGETL